MNDWLQKYGIHPDQLPKPSESGSLLIAGSGHTVWEDARDFLEGRTHMDVMCVNDMGMHWPFEFQHWYSNDWRWLPRWAAARRPRYQMEQEAPKLHTCSEGGQTHWPWPGHGSSSLNAVFTGLALGYDRIILCGVPLDNKGHYFDPPYPSSADARTNFDREGTLKPWRQIAPYFKNQVFSMSGNSREILGAPSSSSRSDGQDRPWSPTSSGSTASG